MLDCFDHGGLQRRFIGLVCIRDDREIFRLSAVRVLDLALRHVEPATLAMLEVPAVIDALALRMDHKREVTAQSALVHRLVVEYFDFDLFHCYSLL